LWCCWLLRSILESSCREVMLSYLSKTISTLCHDIASMQDSHNPDSAGASYDDVTQFVLEQLGKMPPFLSRPILLATALFGMSRLLLEGSLFHNRQHEQRRLQVESWRRSRFGPGRDLIKFYTSLVVLALYSRRETGVREIAGDG
jgi:hypothetical protein